MTEASAMKACAVASFLMHLTATLVPLQSPTITSDEDRDKVTFQCNIILAQATLDPVIMALMYEIKLCRDPCEINSSPPNSPLPMVCRSFSSFLFKAQPPATRRQVTLSRRHSPRQSCYKSNNITIYHPGKSMHYKKLALPDIYCYYHNTFILFYM